MTSKVIFGILILSGFQMTGDPVKSTVLNGILTAKNGDAIPGCNVVLKGWTTASTTQQCGEFEISVSENFEGVLEFSCLAPRTWEIPLKRLKDKENIIISLTDWDNFENGACERNYKTEKRMKIN